MRTVGVAIIVYFLFNKKLFIIAIIVVIIVVVMKLIVGYCYIYLQLAIYYQFIDSMRGFVSNGFSLVTGDINGS